MHFLAPVNAIYILNWISLLGQQLISQECILTSYGIHYCYRKHFFCMHIKAFLLWSERPAHLIPRTSLPHWHSAHISLSLWKGLWGVNRHTHTHTHTRVPLLAQILPSVMLERLLLCIVHHTVTSPTLCSVFRACVWNIIAVITTDECWNGRRAPIL